MTQNIHRRAWPWHQVPSRPPVLQLAVPSSSRASRASRASAQRLRERPRPALPPAELPATPHHCRSCRSPESTSDCCSCSCHPPAGPGRALRAQWVQWVLRLLQALQPQSLRPPRSPTGLTSSHPVLAPEDSCVAPPHLAAVPRAELRAQPEPPQRPEPEPAGCGCAGARADCAWDASAAAGGGGSGGAPPQEPSLRAHGCPRNWVVCLGCPEDPKCSWRDRLVSPAVSFGMVLELEVGWELGSLRNGHLWELEGDWHVAESDAGTVVLEGVERLEPCEVLLDEFLWNNSWALYLGTPDSSHIHVPLVACMGALDCHMAVAPRSCLEEVQCQPPAAA